MSFTKRSHYIPLHNQHIPRTLTSWIDSFSHTWNNKEPAAACDFEDEDELKVALTNALKHLTNDQWEHSRVKLLNDLQLIIDAQGDYL